jgi:hypothetical protein
MKNKVILLFTFIVLLISLSMTSYAYWGDSYLISYYPSTSTYTADLDIPYVVKSTEEKKAAFQGAYISSWSGPKARLVNSNKESRSGWVTLIGDEIKYTSDVSTTFNHYYYAEIEGAWNQLGEDTMRFRYNPY